ncbi:MAG: hypothetical protein KZQ94_10440 [Candidatus Thiodiazotropha sp. (ex Troendleina suluensis)]|nr:hypothetical protein [Candidatus Thiodiazotropha sp. (ex Troendleina suluensis)]
MTDENTQIILAGDVYIDRFDAAGNSVGIVGPVNSDEITISQEVDAMTQTSYMRDSYGQTRASVNMPKPSLIKIHLLDQPADLLAIAFLGDVSAINESIASVSAENVTVVLDRWVDLANRKLNTTLPADAVQDVTDTTTYVEGTDYEINYELGMIRALSTGSITDAEVLHVDYDKAAATGKSITAGTQSQINARLRIDGINKATLELVHTEIFQVTLRPDGDIPLKSAEFITTSLTGELITPEGKSGPMVMDTFVPA